MKISNKNFFDAGILEKQADNMREIILANQLSYTEMLKRYNEATTEAEKNSAQDALEKAGEAYLSSVENYYEKLKSNFEAEVNNIPRGTCFGSFNANNQEVNFNFTNVWFDKFDKAFYSPSWSCGSKGKNINISNCHTGIHVGMASHTLEIDQISLN